MNHIKEIILDLPQFKFIIFSFSFRRNKAQVPPGIPIMDCRSMKNCFSKDKARKSPEFEKLVERGVSILNDKKVLACGCDYGKHRSVAVAEEIATRVGGKAVKI